MTSIVILAVISWGLVAFWFVYTAFGSALLSLAGERPTLRARVLQFPVPQSEIAAPAVSVNTANAPKRRTGSAGEVRYRRFDQ